MKKIYTMPIYGSLIQLNPRPKGQDDDPVSPVSIFDLPNPPQKVLDGEFLNPVIDYDFDAGTARIELDSDQDVHDWMEEVLDPDMGVDGKSKAEISLSDNGLTFQRKDLV